MKHEELEIKRKTVNLFFKQLTFSGELSIRPCLGGPRVTIAQAIETFDRIDPDFQKFVDTVQPSTSIIYPEVYQMYDGRIKSTLVKLLASLCPELVAEFSFQALQKVHISKLTEVLINTRRVFDSQEQIIVFVNENKAFFNQESQGILIPFINEHHGVKSVWITRIHIDQKKRRQASLYPLSSAFKWCGRYKHPLILNSMSV